MSDASSSDLDYARLQLRELQSGFVGRLPARLSEIRASLDRLTENAGDAGVLETLHRQVHSLTGSAGTFGMPELSGAARSLESRLSEAIRRGTPVGSEVFSAIRSGAEQLSLAAMNRPQAEPDGVPLPRAPLAQNPGASVHLVVDDAVQLGILAEALQTHGYEVKRYASLQAFRLRHASNKPGPGDAVVMDVAFGRDDPAGARLLGALELGRHGRTPVVVAVADDALKVRLAASRAGANLTLRSPMEPGRLVERLDLLTGRQPAQPYRVLLVDDDPFLLEAQAGVLRAAGMDVRSLCQPLQTLEALQAFAPDVLLLDVYMPEVSGPELAAALRERDTHVHLPILFLSAETDLSQQLLALNLGGDDFLVKPVQPDHLVAAVTARARRARQAAALRTRLQTALYEREREHLALDHHAIVSIADREGRITYANDLFCQVSGYARSELLGQNHRMLTAGLHKSGFIRTIWRSVEAGTVWHGEMCCQRKNGSRYWVESTITPFLDSAGLVYQYVAIQTDISHIKAAEAALRTQRDMQRVISLSAAALMAAPPDQTHEALAQALQESGQRLQADRAYLYTFSRDGRHMNNAQTWSAPGSAPMVAEALRVPLDRLPWMRERFLVEDVLQIPDVAAMVPEAASDQAVLQASRVGSIVLLPLRREGQPFGFLAYSMQDLARRWTDEEIALFMVLRDVMASALVRTWADNALRKSESRLHFLVASSPVVIHTRDVQAPHVLRYVSPNAQHLMGLLPRDVVGQADLVAARVHPDDAPRVAAAWPEIVQSGELRLEYRLTMGDGKHRWVQEQSRLVRDGAGEPQEIIGYWMDITERKQYETELSAFNHELEQRVEAQTRDVLASERLAQGTLDALSARVVILDEQGDIVAANRAWRGFYGGRTPKSVGNYLRYCECQDLTSGRDAVTYLAPGLRAVLSGVERSHLQEYGQELNGELRWFVCRIERFGTDEAPRLVVSHEDITALKQAERAQLRSQRLESLGTLAGGVAHDLNNALAPVLMGMSILKEDYPQETKLFDMIESSAQRGTDMVRQLLTFAKGAEGERVSVCPSQVVNEIERLIKGSFPKNIGLQLQCEADLPVVVGDPTQLHQVLLNLCVNARDAMRHGGTLTLGLQALELDPTFARSIPDAKPGRYVAWRVSDTGSGIPLNILDRIFDPFFTTKGADKGTGLGLSTVLGIVKGHGGFVQVSSQQGQGTTFTVYLPASTPGSGTVAGAPVMELADKGLGREETILFVDDEAAVREVARAVLERLNYQPLVATDGADALLQVAAHRTTLAAVITDLHMPHMDGLAFVRELRQTLPDLPVILASGRLEETVWTELLALGVVHRLDKPFTQQQIALVLSEVLGP